MGGILKLKERVVERVQACSLLKSFKDDPVFSCSLNPTNLSPFLVFASPVISGGNFATGGKKMKEE